MERITYHRELQTASTMPWLFDATIGVRSARRRMVETKPLILLRNMAGNTSAILQLSQFHLFHSYPDITEKFAGALKSKKPPDSNTIELFREHSLQSAIVFSNASLEYLQILLMIAFADFSTITQLAPQERVRRKMRADNLAEHDWDVGLYSVLQTKYSAWWDTNRRLVPVWLEREYEGLAADNFKLKTTYQANQLKHYSFATFTRSDKRNIMRQDFAKTDNMDDFYTRPLRGMALGSRGNILDLDATAAFVEEYQDSSIRLYNRLLGSMRFKQDVEFL